LPDFVHHELIYSYQDPGGINIGEFSVKFGENSDGVVALTSQLYPPAQRQSSGQFGFNNTHTSILRSEEVAEYINDQMAMVKNAFPPAQLQLLLQGGYDVNLGEDYPPLAQYSIHHYGHYLMALTNGTVSTFHPEEERFIAVVNGKKNPQNEAEKGWLKFLDEYPEFKEEGLHAEIH
jgi:hypothetical protein